MKHFIATRVCEFFLQTCFRATIQSPFSPFFIPYSNRESVESWCSNEWKRRQVRYDTGYFLTHLCLPAIKIEEEIKYRYKSCKHERELNHSFEPHTRVLYTMTTCIRTICKQGVCRRIKIFYFWLHANR